MPTFLTRADREIVEVSGVGGMLKVAQPNYRTETVQSYTILDVTAWRLRHTFNLADITHSGSFGGEKRAMTSRHWEASLALAWNSAARVAGQPFSGFLEALFIGNQAAGFNVAVIFFLGDPLNYIDNQHLLRASGKLAAPLALCQNIETINDGSGKDVVRATGALQGNSKLQGWTGLGEALTNRVF
jgi:hypothetical protein